MSKPVILIAFVTAVVIAGKFYRKIYSPNPSSPWITRKSQSARKEWAKSPKCHEVIECCCRHALKESALHFTGKSPNNSSYGTESISLIGLGHAWCIKVVVCDNHLEEFPDSKPTATGLSGILIVRTWKEIDSIFGPSWLPAAKVYLIIHKE